MNTTIKGAIWYQVSPAALYVLLQCTTTIAIISAEATDSVE
jgi:hypothetical protein